MAGEAATALSPQTQHGDVIWAISRGRDEKPPGPLGPLPVTMDHMPSVSSPGLDLGKRSPSRTFGKGKAGVAPGLAFGLTKGRGWLWSPQGPDPRPREGATG